VAITITAFTSITLLGRAVMKTLLLDNPVQNSPKITCQCWCIPLHSDCKCDVIVYTGFYIITMVFTNADKSCWQWGSNYKSYNLRSRKLRPTNCINILPVLANYEHNADADATVTW